MTEATGTTNTASVQNIQPRHTQRLTGVLAAGARPDVDKDAATFFRANTHGVTAIDANFTGVTAFETVGTLPNLEGLRAESAAPRIGMLRRSKAIAGKKIGDTPLYEVGRKGGDEVGGLGA